MAYGLRHVLRLATLLLGITAASTIYAGATVKVTPTGARADETALRLVDSYGAPLAADPGDRNSFTDLPPGIYLAQVFVGDRPAGPQTTIGLEQGESEIRIAAAGVTEVKPPIAQRQQQLMMQAAWSFGVLGGWKWTPYDMTFTSNIFGANARTGAEETAGALAAEVRYNFSRRQQNLGARLFLFGTYIHYFGTDAERRFVNLHPTPGLDTGGRIEEKRSFGFGLGAHWNIAQRVGFELLLGAAATRLEFAALSNESGGGGGDVRIPRRATEWGPLIALGLTYPVFQAVTGTARLYAMRMGDQDVAGRSPLVPVWDYAARFHGGWQYMCMLGLLF